MKWINNSSNIKTSKISQDLRKWNWKHEQKLRKKQTETGWGTPLRPVFFHSKNYHLNWCTTGDVVAIVCQPTLISHGCSLINNRSAIFFNYYYCDWFNQVQYLSHSHFSHTQMKKNAYIFIDMKPDWWP